MTRSPEIQPDIDEALADRMHGWWVAAVLDQFSFLETDFAYGLVKVHLHFRGTFLRYARLENDLAFEHDPDDTGRLFASFTRLPTPIDPLRSPEVVSVNRLLRARDPNLTLPDEGRLHQDRATVLAALAIWSRGLRELASDVLDGQWPVVP